MESTNEEHLQMVREYEVEKRKDEKLGFYANVLIQKYINEPRLFPMEFIMEQLVLKHAEIGFDKIKSRGDEER